MGAEWIGMGNDGSTIRMYWLDAYEDPVKHPGTVYLFGRVETQASTPASQTCCVVVRNVPRQLFFLKRKWDRRSADAVSFETMEAEVEQRLRSHEFSLRQIRCRQCPPNEWRYLRRGADVQDDPDGMLEVQVEAIAGKCPQPDMCGNTFDSVLNTTTTALERLLTHFAVMGPSWVEISGAQPADPRVSYCQLEYIVDMGQMDAIRLPPGLLNKPPPTVCLAAMNVLTALNEKDNEAQVVMISMLYDDAFSLDKSVQLDTDRLQRFCVLTKLQNGVSLPFNLEDTLRQQGLHECTKRVVDERSLLSYFLAKLTRLNPDILLAHDLSAHLQLLRTRLTKHGLPNWSQLGRLKRTIALKALPPQFKAIQWEFTAGRACLDAKVASAELVHARSYDLDELVNHVLKPLDGSVTRKAYSAEDISSPFTSTSLKLSLTDLMNWSWTEVYLALRIIHQLNAIPLFFQITQIVGGVLSRTAMGGRADRNDYLLLHACYRNKYVAPDKWAKPVKGRGKPKKDEENDERLEDDDDAGEDAPAAKKKTGPQYSGGLVLEPKRGLYQSFVVLLDFNSLYPSIIQEYNVCFTTVDNAFVEVPESALPAMPCSKKPDGILKREIHKLVNRRREVKAQMQRLAPGSELYMQCHIRQMGLKLTANSMYGCLGFEMSRFYARTLAAMITSKGREILMQTKELVEAEGHAVIYGDTDSIMIDTGKTELPNALAIGAKLKQAVNRNYKQLELDLDGVYKRLLLLRKKKYAALSVLDLNGPGTVLRKEMKGLDIVRRDWAEMAKNIGEEVLDLILSSNDRELLAGSVITALRDFRANLDAGLVPFEKFEILKQLHKDPEVDAATNERTLQSHVKVAARLNATMHFRLKHGDIVKYIVCQDGTTAIATQRAYHRSELEAQPDKLKPDLEYYVKSQVLPIVSRLCEPIDELSPSRIAEAIGLMNFRVPGDAGNKGAKRLHSVLDAEDKPPEYFKVNLAEVLAPLFDEK